MLTTFEETDRYKVAKLFKNGSSQAVRLPADFQFDGDKVYATRDPETGFVTLMPTPLSWDSFFRLSEKSNIDDDFMQERDLSPSPPRHLFD